jgi:hypothetical protein
MNTRMKAPARSAAAVITAITLTALLFEPPRPASAEDATAGAPDEWMSRYATARTMGLGGAYVAVADDPLGVIWNPAGLSAMDQNELRFENARLFEDTSINGFSFAVPGSWLPSFGVTMLALGSGEYQRTNDMNDPLGTFRNTETAYLFTMSKAFSTRFAVGTNLKLVQQRVEDFSAGGFGVDVGGWYNVVPGLRLGATVSNLAGPELTLRDVAEAYPLQLRGGAALQVLGGRGLISAQVDQSEGLGTRMHAGAEYWIGSGMALRVGFDDNYETGGFSYRFAPQYQLDYGVADQALGLTHRVGLSCRFGGFFASSHAEPAVFSPTGEKAVTRIDLNARTKAAADVWTLEIVSKGAEVVRRFSGKGQPPAHVEWDGKDEAGMPLADGVYRYSLTVKDHAGREVVAHARTIEIFTSGPQGQVPVIPVGQQTEEQR